jgi:hypothetical protein
MSRTNSIITNIKKGRQKVMDDLNKYVDRCLIDEYADKNLEEGHILDIDSVPENEQTNFLIKLFETDTGLRDFALHYMQKMIDERLPEVTKNDRFEQDFGDIYQMRYV